MSSKFDHENCLLFYSTNTYWLPNKWAGEKNKKRKSYETYLNAENRAIIPIRLGVCPSGTIGSRGERFILCKCEIGSEK